MNQAPQHIREALQTLYRALHDAEGLDQMIDVLRAVLGEGQRSVLAHDGDADVIRNVATTYISLAGLVLAAVADPLGDHGRDGWHSYRRRVLEIFNEEGSKAIALSDRAAGMDPRDVARRLRSGERL